MYDAEKLADKTGKAKVRVRKRLLFGVVGVLVLILATIGVLIYQQTSRSGPSGSSFNIFKTPQPGSLLVVKDLQLFIHRYRKPIMISVAVLGVLLLVAGTLVVGWFFVLSEEAKSTILDVFDSNTEKDLDNSAGSGGAVSKENGDSELIFDLEVIIGSIVSFLVLIGITVFIVSTVRKFVIKPCKTNTNVVHTPGNEALEDFYLVGGTGAAAVVANPIAVNADVLPEKPTKILEVPKSVEIKTETPDSNQYVKLKKIYIDLMKNPEVNSDNPLAIDLTVQGEKKYVVFPKQHNLQQICKNINIKWRQNKETLILAPFDKESKIFLNKFATYDNETIEFVALTMDEFEKRVKTARLDWLQSILGGAKLDDKFTRPSFAWPFESVSP